MQSRGAILSWEDLKTYPIAPGGALRLGDLPQKKVGGGKKHKERRKKGEKKERTKIEQRDTLKN